METPCPRCGHSKTESVRHGFLHDTLWNLGYHLRVCSFCNRWRLFKRMDLTQPHPDDLTVEQLQENFNRKIAESMNDESAGTETTEANMAAGSSEESDRFETQPGEASIGVAEVPPEVETEDYHLCPRCGGTNYRRSRRRWYERLMKRPRMARCMKCEHRFPYPH
jgi:hypothetical protein